jgi:hypothetical protein
MTRKQLILIVILGLAAGLLLALTACDSHAASDVTLAWDANTEPDLAGYKIHWGTASRVYTTHVDAGNVTTFVLKGLPDGKVYIAATAYDKAGLESDYSNEVSITLDSTPPAYPKNLKSVSVKVTISTSSGSITATATTGQ